MRAPQVDEHHVRADLDDIADGDEQIVLAENMQPAAFPRHGDAEHLPFGEAEHNIARSAEVPAVDYVHHIFTLQLPVRSIHAPSCPPRRPACGARRDPSYYTVYARTARACHTFRRFFRRSFRRSFRRHCADAGEGTDKCGIRSAKNIRPRHAAGGKGSFISGAAPFAASLSFLRLFCRGGRRHVGNGRAADRRIIPVRVPELIGDFTERNAQEGRKAVRADGAPNLGEKTVVYVQ